MARHGDADRRQQTEFLFVGKVSGMADRRRRRIQDIESADGKRDGVAEMYSWNCGFHGYGQCEWHNDNDHRQHLHDKPTKGKIRAVGPCHTRGREHKICEQTPYR